MKTVTLNLSARLKALNILGEAKGFSIDTLARALDDAKLLTITEEEWEQGNRVKTPGLDEMGRPSETWQWDDEKGPQKEVTLNDSTVDYLRSYIKDKDEKKELTLNDRAIIALKEALN